MLQPHVDRERERLLVAAQAVVERLLDAGDAVVVDVDKAEDVRQVMALRIDARLLALEIEAGDAEAQDLPLLMRRQLAV